MNSKTIKIAAFFLFGAGLALALNACGLHANCPPAETTYVNISTGTYNSAGSNDTSANSTSPSWNGPPPFEQEELTMEIDTSSKTATISSNESSFEWVLQE